MGEKREPRDEKREVRSEKKDPRSEKEPRIRIALPCPFDVEVVFRINY